VASHCADLVLALGRGNERLEDFLPLPAAPVEDGSEKGCKRVVGVPDIGGPPRDPDGVGLVALEHPRKPNDLRSADRQGQ
jgi:hypothetical protein